MALNFQNSNITLNESSILTICTVQVSNRVKNPWFQFSLQLKMTSFYCDFQKNTTFYFFGSISLSFFFWAIFSNVGEKLCLITWILIVILYQKTVKRSWLMTRNEIYRVKSCNPLNISAKTPSIFRTDYSRDRISHVMIGCVKWSKLLRC